MYKTWRESFNKLVVCMENNDGSWDIDTKDKDNFKLRKWLREQQNHFRKLKEG